MRKTFSSFFLFAVGLGSLDAQALQDAPWETILPPERHRFRYDLVGAVHGQLQEQRYAFFPSNSGSSGERYHFYLRMQYREASERNHWHFTLPPGSSLTHLDYRVWRNNLITYEAKAHRLQEDLIDTIFAEGGGAIQGFTLRLRELEPACVVEFYFQCQGVALPYWLDLSSSFPLAESRVLFQVPGANPLQFSHHSSISAKQYRRYDQWHYRFDIYSPPRPRPAYGLPVYDAENPFLAIDWADQVYPDDHETRRNWFDLLPHLFYEGSIRNYTAFANHLSLALGERANLGPALQIPSYFHLRGAQLRTNARRLNEIILLSRNRGEYLVALEDRVNALARNPDLTWREALHRLQSWLQNYYQDWREEPRPPAEIFQEHALLGRYYAIFFRLRGFTFQPALLRRASQGFADSTFHSVRPFQAQAYAFQPPGDSVWHWQLIGPQSGTLYPPDSFPAYFQGGYAWRFDSKQNKIWTDTLSQGHFAPGLVHIASDWNYSFPYGWHRKKSHYRFEGLFRNPIYHLPLISDTVAAWFDHPSEAFFHQHQLRDYWSGETQQESGLGDTISDSLPLAALWLAGELPAKAERLNLPMAYKINWAIDVRCDVPCALEMDSLHWESKLGDLHLRVEKYHSRYHQLKVHFSWNRAFVPFVGADEQELFKLLNKGLPFHLYPLP